MNNNMVYIFLMIIVAIILILMASRYGTENLSLSQFPVPTCSTCSSCKFYTCGKCGTWYQEQNKLGQACDCGGQTIYRTKLQPACYGQTLKGGPELGEVRTCKEPFQGTAVQNTAMIGFKPLQPQRLCGACADSVANKSSCASCTGDYTCLEPGSTFDSGSTMARNLPCPAPFPPVVPGMEAVMHKQLMHTSELDVYNHLQQGGLIVAANSGDVIDYTMKVLQKHTVANSREGYPDFYYINGPVVVMSKVGSNYYWMIDYPIKYNPQNFANYVNTSNNWNIAKTAYKTGSKLLNLNAPVIFFAAGAGAGRCLKAAAAACMPKGNPQSNTDYYYPGCSQKSCLWGVPYGDSNWLTRV